MILQVKRILNFHSMKYDTKLGNNSKNKEYLTAQSFFELQQ